ncbi:tetraspanin-9 [Ooceraea biroi]|nr:tetraspanin-9 [Ooceraea biroi]
MIGRGDDANEIEAYEDEVPGDDETVASEKSAKNIGAFLRELFSRRLPDECVKFSFLLLNGMALLVGITAIVTSAWMLADGDFTSRLNGQRLAMTILLILGVFVSLVAFTGIVGVVARRRHFMIFYLICQSIALCAIFVCVTMSFSFFDKIARKIRDDMINSVANYQSLNWATEAWDNTQRYLKCCGIKSSNDWWDYQMDIPRSCCAVSVVECLYMTENVAYKNGCLKGALLLLKSYVHAASVSMLIVFPFLLGSVLLALGLLRRALGASHSSGDQVTQRRQG